MYNVCRNPSGLLGWIDYIYYYWYSKRFKARNRFWQVRGRGTLDAEHSRGWFPVKEEQLRKTLGAALAWDLI